VIPFNLHPPSDPSYFHLLSTSRTIQIDHASWNPLMPLSHFPESISMERHQGIPSLQVHCAFAYGLLRATFYTANQTPNSKTACSILAQ